MKYDYDQALERSVALDTFRQQWAPQVPTETVPLNKAYGRVCAEDVVACASFPVVRSSQRDGIAVKSAAFADGMPDSENWVKGVDYAQADTGDDFPDDFDAVVAIEGVIRLPEGGIKFVDENLQVKAGDAVNPSGCIVKAGDLLARAHERLTPELVAACAVGGVAQVKVFRPCTVAFVPTGSELIPWGSFPQRGQNIESNSLLISGLVEQFGATCIAYPVVKDNPELLEAALDRALEAADIVIINGGSSRGEEDYNSQMLQQRASWFRHGVRALPGRPVGMSIIQEKPVINVPGPVLACFLAMDWLIRGLVDHYYGATPTQRVMVEATVAAPMKKPVPFERLIRVALTPAEDGGLLVQPLKDGMGVPAQLTRADGMLTLPIGSEGAQVGEKVQVALLRPLEQIKASWSL